MIPSMKRSPLGSSMNLKNMVDLWSRYISENPMRQDEKFLLINQGFSGKQRLMLFFNRSNNEDLILVIQTAGVRRGRNGFKKDKSGEKLAESEEDLLEHRTVGTDSTFAFDVLYIGCEKFPYRDIFPYPYQELYNLKLTVSQYKFSLFLFGFGKI